MFVLSMRASLMIKLSSAPFAMLVFIKPARVANSLTKFLMTIGIVIDVLPSCRTPIKNRLTSNVSSVIKYEAQCDASIKKRKIFGPT